MKTKVIPLILILIATLSCKNERPAERISVADNLELHLNNGDKWIVNPETHEGIKIMDSIISAFKKENKKDYNALGKALSKQTSYIIKNCSMKGEPHDQLHVVLIPMLDEILFLRASGNTTDSYKALTTLDALIDTYFKHFKL